MDFVDFEIAKKLKLKGFNEPCWNAINSFGCTYRNGWLEYLYEQGNELFVQNDLKEGDYLLPTISQVLKWFRKNKSIYMYVKRDTYHLKFRYVFEKDKPRGETISEIYESYEEAANKGIEYLLDNLI